MGINHCIVYIAILCIVSCIFFVYIGSGRLIDLSNQRKKKVKERSRVIGRGDEALFFEPLHIPLYNSI